MKVVSINTVNYGSTGKIMRSITSLANDCGCEAIMYMRGWKGNTYEKNLFYIGSYLENGLHKVLSRVTGLNGFFTIVGTQKLINKLKQFKPDVIHIHNLHDSYICVPLLFRYIKKNDIRVIWTLHDCWSFTGKCAYFTAANCDRWKTGCYDCPQLNGYPIAYVDRTKLMWKKKKSIFCGVKDMTIVTPSKWLADLASVSFLKAYPIKVINNGIDLEIFKPEDSEFRKENKINDKAIILGVASGWEERKGLDVFLRLNEDLGDRYQIVLVGVDDETKSKLPKSIISVSKTRNQNELAKIYSAADVFVNPTREDNFPTTNIEAIACGTPVVTFDTGGSSEMIDDTCGFSVPCGDYAGLKEKIIMVCDDKPFSIEDCLRKARGFSDKDKFKEYVDLYADKE